MFLTRLCFIFSVVLPAFNIDALRVPVELHNNTYRKTQRIEISRKLHTSPLAPVAGCLVGEARVLACNHVWPNILQSMVDPIRSSLDLFSALKLHSDKFGAPQCLGSGKDAQQYFTQFLKDKFAVVNMFFRDSHDSKSTSGVHCRSLIEEHERTVRHGFGYQWFLVLRGDVIYNAKLQSFSMWPEFGVREKLVYVECCGSCGAPRPVDKLVGKCPFMCLQTIFGNTLGCAKDTWALMTRKALPIYYKTENDQLAEISNGSCYSAGRPSPMAECRLGCQLNRYGVKVNLVQRLRRKLLHATIPREDTNGTFLIGLPDFREPQCDKVRREDEAEPGPFTIQLLG